MNILKMILLAMVILSSTPVLADVRYRAGYEIKFGDGGKNGGSIQTKSWLSAQESVTHKFGEYEVSILLGEVSDTTYTVIITVKETTALAIDNELIRHSFDGSFNGITEFAANKFPISIDGAIAVNRLEN